LGRRYFWRPPWGVPSHIWHIPVQFVQSASQLTNSLRVYLTTEVIPNSVRTTEGLLPLRDRLHRRGQPDRSPLRAQLTSLQPNSLRPPPNLTEVQHHRRSLRATSTRTSSSHQCLNLGPTHSVQPNEDGSRVSSAWWQLPAKDLLSGRTSFRPKTRRPALFVHRRRLSLRPKPWISPFGQRAAT
jgi:hypothetical protein